MVSRGKVILILTSIVLVSLGMYLLFLGSSQHSLREVGTKSSSTTVVTNTSCEILIVYRTPLNESAKEILSKISSIISQHLSSDMHCAQYRFVKSDSFTHGFIPVYPALIVKSKKLPPTLAPAFLKISSNYWLLKPPYLYYLIQGGGGKVRLEYMLKAKVYVVRGSSEVINSLTQIQNYRLLKNTIQWTAALDVESIKEVNFSTYPSLPYYPAVVIVPLNRSVNVSNYSPIVIRWGKYYIYEPLWFNSNLLPLIMNLSSGNIILEVHSKPDFSGPTVGNSSASLKFLMFEDINCPFCAKLFSDTVPLLYLKYVETGKASITFHLLTVHSESQRIHELLSCYYKHEGDSKKYYDLLLKLYRIVRGGKRVGITEFKELSGAEPNEILKDCNSSIILNNYLNQARKYGITGTPALIIWSKSKGYGVLIIGYIDFNKLDSLVKSLITH